MNEIPSSVSFQSLTEKFELTKKELGEAEESIRRITGREPDTFPNGGPGFNKRKFLPGFPQGKPLPGQKRPLFPIIKPEEAAAEDSPEEDDSPSKKPSLQSTVVATSNDSKSRKDSIQEQNVNSRVKARNRRMFGMMLGTLQKFQNEETKRKVQETRRAEIEQKVEAAVVEEKEKAKKEKEELFVTRKEKQVMLRCLEKKMEIAELHETWENSQKQMVNYIKTSAEPCIYFLPANHNKKSKKLLEESQAKVLELIKQRREETEKELLEIEELYKRDNFPNDKENIGPFDNESEDTTQELEVDSVPEEVVHDSEATAGEIIDSENKPSGDSFTPVHEEGDRKNISSSDSPSNNDSNAHTVIQKEDGDPSEDRTIVSGDENNVKMADQEFEPIYD